MTKTGSKRQLLFDGKEFADLRRKRRRVITKASEGISRRQQKVAPNTPVGCDYCDLKNSCESPMMEPYGDGRLEILLIAEAPGREEDEQNIPMVGQAGRFLKRCLGHAGIDMDVDCWRINAVQCRPPQNRTPLPLEIEHCRKRVDSQIAELRPGLILAFGRSAVNSLLLPPRSFAISHTQGLLFASQRLKTWIGSFYHPSFVGVRNAIMDVETYSVQIGKVLDRYAGKPAGFPMPLDPEIIDCTSASQFDAVTNSGPVEGKPMGLDIETTGLSPYDDNAEIISIAIALSPKNCIFIHLPTLPMGEKLGLQEALRMYFNDARQKKVVQSAGFESTWIQEAFGVELRGIVHDTIVASHIIDERPEITGLDFQVFQHWGVTYKQMVNRKKIVGTSRETLARYNCLDACYTLALAELQHREFEPDDAGAYKFFHRCLPVLTDMKSRGIHVDLDELDKNKKYAEDIVSTALSELKATRVCRDYMKKYPAFNIFSTEQLRDFLFSHLGLEHTDFRTAGGQPCVNKAALQQIIERSPKDGRAGGGVALFCRRLLDMKRFDHVGKYLNNYLKLVDSNGVLHPSYHLNIARTYRSSSSDPNFQNVPHHDSDQSRIRCIFVPRNGLFLEVDYRAAEVRVLAMCSGDENLRDFILGGYDMHREWAARLGDVAIDSVTSEERSRAKTYWVFPMFYGARAESCSLAFTDLRKPLSYFERQEDEFWSMFPGVKAWQQNLLDYYARTGEVVSPLGFRRRAPLKPNKIINHPIQATSFHLLLDGAARANSAMRKAGLKSLIVAQIHDSILVDLVGKERNAVINILLQSLTEKRFDWENDIPMELEFSIGPNWGMMEEIDIAT